MTNDTSIKSRFIEGLRRNVDTVVDSFITDQLFSVEWNLKAESFHTDGLSRAGGARHCFTVWLLKSRVYPAGESHEIAACFFYPHWGRSSISLPLYTTTTHYSSQLGACLRFMFVETRQTHHIEIFQQTAVCSGRDHV